MSAPAVGFVLAAGFGKRMGELTTDTPKPLLPVGGVPLIYYALFNLYQWGVGAAVINLHYLGEQIEAELKDFPHFPLFFSREHREILGTAGGLRFARELLREAGRVAAPDGPRDQACVLINPDTIYLPAPSDRPRREWLNGATTCFHMKRKPPGNTEPGWNPTGPPDADGVRPLRFDPNGSYYYAGYSVIDPAACVADLADNTFAELGPIWRDQSGQGKIVGREFEGKIVDAGTRAAYDLIRDQDLIEPDARDAWRAFLSHRFQAGRNRRRI